MRKSLYTEEQIITALKGHESGRKTVDICRELGISEGTFYRWKSKFGGMEVSEAKRLRSLEEENRQLKKLLAKSMLDQEALKTALSKKY